MSFGQRGPGQREHGRHQVDADRQLIADGAGRYVTGPPGDRRHAVPPFPVAPLESAQRPVGSPLVGPVVGAEEDQRVLRQAQPLDRGHHPADTLVHLLHHLPIGLLDVGLCGSLAGGPGASGRAPLGRIAGALVGTVYGLVGDVDAERPALVLLDESSRVPGNQMGHVARLLNQLQPLPPVVHSHPIVVRNVVDVAADVSAEAVESVVHRIELLLVAQVPLAEDGRLIADQLEPFGKGDLGYLQAAMVGGDLGVGVDHPRDAGPLLIAPGDQSRARGAAHVSAAVEVGKPHPLGGQLVQVRRFDPAAVGAGVAVAEVVGKDDNHVGFGIGRRRGRAESQQGGHQQAGQPVGGAKRGHFAEKRLHIEPPGPARHS